MKNEMKTFMGYLWVLNEDGVVTIGVQEDALQEITGNITLDFPKEKDTVSADEICATLEAEDGSLDIYSPCDGTVLEVNTALSEDTSILFDDPYGEGWLLRVEAEEDFEIDEDDDDDDEDDDDDDYEDED